MAPWGGLGDGDLGGDVDVHSASIVWGSDRWGLNPEHKRWNPFYGLPEDYETLLPAGSVVINGLHDTHSFPLAGRTGHYRVADQGDCGFRIDWARSASAGRVIARWSTEPGFRWWGRWHGGPHDLVITALPQRCPSEHASAPSD